MQRVLRRGARLAALLLAAICLYTGLLLAAYAFPDEWISDNVGAAVNVLTEEGNMVGGYANYFWHTGFSITDNLTDIRIYQGLLRDGRSVVDAAMRTDYARYWHGYAVVLRPLMIVLSIVNIRYLNMMALMALFLVCGWKCRERFGWRTAVHFCAGLLMSFLLIAPFCQQYMPVTFLALAGSAAVLCGWKAARNRLYEFFFLLGSLVCFFDFLTFPVLALGYPLACCLLQMVGDGEGPAPIWKKTLLLSAAWVLGYGLTWVAKGIIGTLLTGENVLGDILSQAAFRTTGAFYTDTGAVDVSMRSAVLINLETFFMGANIGAFALMLLVEGVYAVRKGRLENWPQALALAAVALWPVIWYCVLQNHSRLHFWMTYKQLSVTVFAGCSALRALGGVRVDRSCGEVQKRA